MTRNPTRRLGVPVVEARRLARRSAAEFIGTGFLVAAVIGSGVAATRLSPGDVGLQLLENGLITGAALVALILALQPVSAAFNPIVTLVEAAFGGPSASSLTPSPWGPAPGERCSARSTTRQEENHAFRHCPWRRSGDRPREARLEAPRRDPVARMITGLDHVQVAIPVGGEPVAREYYAGVLGMTEVAKPPALAARGGCWFTAGSAVLHLGVEDPFAPAKKAHPAFLVTDLDGLAATLDERRATVTRSDDQLPGIRRFHTFDPFGNRLEFQQG